MSYTFKDFSELPEPSANSILSQTVYNDDTVKVTLFSFAMGQELTQHTASKPALLHVLQGSAVLGLGEDTLEAKAGTWVHMPAHLPHSVTAKTNLHFLLTLLKGTP
jgi:quercetin dioxygenase-like cupin family protein